MNDISKLEVGEEEASAIMALGDNLAIIGTLFQTGEGTPTGLRMCVAGLREGARILEGICDRWEAS